MAQVVAGPALDVQDDASKAAQPDPKEALVGRPTGAPVGSIVDLTVAALAAIDIVLAVVSRRSDPDGPRPRWRRSRT